MRSEYLKHVGQTVTIKNQWKKNYQALSDFPPASDLTILSLCCDLQYCEYMVLSWIDGDGVLRRLLVHVLHLEFAPNIEKMVQVIRTKMKSVPNVR